MSEKAHEGGPEIDMEDIPLPLPPKRPRTVAIVACGATQADWHNVNYTYERKVPRVDVVWSLNKALRTVKCDLGFVMDDLVGECRRSPEYAADLAELQVPIITSTVDPQVKALLPKVDLWPYPVAAVIHFAGCLILKHRGSSYAEIKARPDRVHFYAQHAANYLHNSVPYMLAYALFLGMQGVQLWGADYTFPGQEAREDDRANCEYWVGMLRMAGVELYVSPRTTLLNQRQQPYLYGFGARPPVIEPPDNETLDILLAKLALHMTRPA